MPPNTWRNEPCWSISAIEIVVGRELGKGGIECHPILRELGAEEDPERVVRDAAEEGCGLAEAGQAARGVEGPPAAVRSQVLWTAGDEVDERFA
jgi:hypothetical protein